MRQASHVHFVLMRAREAGNWQSAVDLWDDWQKASGGKKGHAANEIGAREGQQIWFLLINTLKKSKKGERALKMFHLMQKRGVPADEWVGN
jgi:pentatricopeptide repeat protein